MALAWWNIVVETSIQESYAALHMKKKCSPENPDLALSCELVIMSMSGGVDEWENYASIRGAAYESVPV